MRTLAEAVGYALGGLAYAVRTQRTLRLHLLIAAGVGLLLVWLQLPGVQAAVVVLAMVLVIMIELMNTAVEALVDLLVERNYHDLAKTGKDIAAGAVLMTATGAAIVGLLLLGPPLVVRLGLSSTLAEQISRIGVLLAGGAGVAGGIFAILRSHRQPSRPSSRGLPPQSSPADGRGGGSAAS